MLIVPVIDLKQGKVVHARAGQRDRYEPLRSLLCEGSDPVSVVEGLLDLYPFPRLYVADLDAIAGGPGHDHVLDRLAAMFPDLNLWVDRGISSAPTGLAWLSRGLGELVLGSESLLEAEVPARFASAGVGDSIILSLDFSGDRFLGPEALLRRAELWPARVIVMTLARVGSNAGPDFSRLDDIARRMDGGRVFAAGGVRGLHDLHELVSRGVAGVLVASALHDGRLGSRDIAALVRSGHE